MSAATVSRPAAGRPTGLRIQIYEPLFSLEPLRPAWDKLLTQVPAAWTFSTWEWLASWWRAFGAGQQLRFLAFWDSHEELAGIGALALTELVVFRGLRIRLLRMMGDSTIDSDNLDVIARPGFERQVANSSLITSISRETRGMCARSIPCRPTPLWQNTYSVNFSHAIGFTSVRNVRVA